MEKFIIKGGIPLRGEVRISGAKNAAVAIIPAAILAEDKCILENVPSISDVDVALEILSSMGAQIRRLSKSKIEVDTSRIKDKRKQLFFRCAAWQIQEGERAATGWVRPWQQTYRSAYQVL